MRLVALSLIFLLALFPIPVSSSTEQDSPGWPDVATSGGFLAMCASVDKRPVDSSDVQKIESGYCLGWIAGLTDGIHVAEAVHRVVKPNTIFCPPVGNTYGQMIHIVKKFIADHPEKEHLPTDVVASAALADAFPCEESKK